MSNPLAIAAVTATLKLVLTDALDGAEVTTLPLDKAATAGERINLFLYQTTPNPAYRNMDLPPPGSGLAEEPPLLALNLHYMLTAYGDGEREESDHRLLGMAMRALHDNAILAPQLIADATEGAGRLSGSDLHRQVERVRVTHEPMVLDEMSKLWTAFQTQYRLSAAYRASVVLIESARRRRQALPVLSRGSEDQGADVTPGTPPRLVGVEYRDVETREPGLSAARIAESGQEGEVITLFGERLSRVRQIVVFDPTRSSGRTDEAEADVVARLGPEGRPTDSALRLRLDPALDWVAGGLSVAIEYEGPRGRTRRSNPLRLAVAPAPIVSASGVSALTIEEGSRRKLIVNARVPLRRGGDVFLVLSRVGPGDSPPPLPADSKSAHFSSISPVFDIDGVAPGRYRVQLRVDNVDSLLMLRSGPSFRFDERLEIEL